MTTQLTADFIATAKADDLRNVARELNLFGAWKMTKSQLQEALTNELEGPELATMPTPVDSEVTSDLWATVEPAPSCPLPTQSTPATVQALLLLNPAPTPEPTKKSKKAPKTYNELHVLTTSQADWLLNQASITAESCSDPGRLVVNRQLIRQLIEDVHGVVISEKVFNQLVVMASRRLPRQPLTINSASRFKYLLAEVHAGQTFPPAILVADWLLTNPQVYNQAANAYQAAAEQGLEFIQAYRASI